MEWRDLPDAPSAQARAFLADPTNRHPGQLDVDGIPQARAEELQLALASEAELCATHKVTTTWRDVAGVRCLEVTPESANSDVTHLYLFGGGFYLGGPLQDLQIIAPIVAQTGMRVIAPDYRLAPEHPWPAALEDVQAVARHLVQSGPFVLSGESAGGNLALCVTQFLASKELSAPSALALMSPASDLAESYDTGAFPDDPRLPPAYVTAVSRLYANGQPLDDPRLSPLYGTFGPDWPATVITTGTRDLFLHQCQRLHDTLTDAGAKTHLRVWPGLWHVFEYHPDIPEAALSLGEVSHFLTHHADATHA